MTTTDIVESTARDVIVPGSARDARAAMDRYEAELRQVVKDADWTTWRNRKGEIEGFLNRSGWRKVALWYRLDVTIIHEEVARDEEGQVIWAHVRARAKAPNGQIQDGDGGCHRSERPMEHPEQDVTGTATTRAKNRAISDLVAGGALSAEEVDGAGPVAGGVPAQPWGPTTDSDEDLEQAAKIVETLGGVTLEDAAQFVLAMSQAFGDGIPVACLKMLRGLYRFTGDQRAKAAPAPEDAPPDAAGSAYHNPPDPGAVYPPGHYQGD